MQENKKPKNPQITEQDPFEQDALTLRDYFAAKAMQGELSSQDFKECSWANEKDLSQRSYLIADMLKHNNTQIEAMQKQMAKNSTDELEKKYILILNGLENKDI